METIDRYAFLGCYDLANIELPETLKSIGEYAFECRALTTVRYKGTKAQWAAIQIHKDWKQGAYDLKTVICSDGEITIQ